MKLITHFHLVPRLRMHGATPPLPHMPAWYGASLSMGYVFRMWYIVMHRDDFAFSFTLIYALVTQMVSSLWVLQLKFCMHFTSTFLQIYSSALNFEAIVSYILPSKV
jgi:hypothetical protein